MKKEQIKINTWISRYIHNDRVFCYVLALRYDDVLLAVPKGVLRYGYNGYISPSIEYFQFEIPPIIKNQFDIFHGWIECCDWEISGPRI